MEFSINNAVTMYTLINASIAAVFAAIVAPFVPEALAAFAAAG
jgi:hypothetical protein